MTPTVNSHQVSPQLANDGQSGLGVYHQKVLGSNLESTGSGRQLA